MTSRCRDKAGFFLTECDAMKESPRYSCFVRGLLAAVEKSGDPARELPQLDQKVRASGGYLAANCHMLMHEVGRTFGRRHKVTLETLYRYVPKSNDPGCSAGFGMGLVMHLGTKLVLEPKKVLPVCTELPTWFREYTCVHGSGHALMRGYHGRLKKVLAELQELLELSYFPERIESFDISNISGAENVAGIVVFENAKPARPITAVLS